MRTTHFVILLVQISALQFPVPESLPSRDAAVLVSGSSDHRVGLSRHRQAATYLWDNLQAISPCSLDINRASSATLTSAPPTNAHISSLERLQPLSEHGISRTMPTTHFVILLVQISALQFPVPESLPSRDTAVLVSGSSDHRVGLPRHR
ncbi:hypothetical protein ISCGN_000645 [Ixodes scapularis]